MRPFSALCARISLVLCAPDPCVMCVDRLCRRDAAIPPRKPHCSASAAFSAANSVVSTDAAYVRPTQWILTFEGLILAYSSRSAQPYAASKTILKQSHVRAHDRCLPDTNISRKFTLLSFGYHKFFFDHSLTGTWCCTPRMISALLPAPTQFLNHPKRFTWWQSESNPVPVNSAASGVWSNYSNNFSSVSVRSSADFGCSIARIKFAQISASKRSKNYGNLFTWRPTASGSAPIISAASVGRTNCFQPRILDASSDFDYSFTGTCSCITRTIFAPIQASYQFLNRQNRLTQCQLPSISVFITSASSVVCPNYFCNRLSVSHHPLTDFDCSIARIVPAPIAASRWSNNDENRFSLRHATLDCSSDYNRCVLLLRGGNYSTHTLGQPHLLGLSGTYFSLSVLWVRLPSYVLSASARLICRTTVIRI